MKYLSLVFLFCAIQTFAQSEPVFRIDSFPKAGIVLNEGWKWHAGDDPAWAKEEYDDSGWESIDPTQEFDHLKQIKNVRNGWFRIQLRVDSSLFNSIISMMVIQSIASEIYLNGVQIANFGKVSIHPNKVVAYNPSGMPFAPSEVIHFKLGNQSKQRLAVRFAIEPNIRYVRLLSQNPCLIIKLNAKDTMSRDNFESRGYADVTFLDFFKAGLFFILFLLHLVFYFSYPVHKANLYFGIFCLTATSIYLIQPVCYQFTHYVSVRMHLVMADWVLFSVLELFLLRAVYSLFNYSLKIFFWSLLSFSCVGFILFFLDFDWAITLGFLLIILANLDAARVAIIAFRANIKGAWILMSGTFGYAIFTLIYFVIVSFSKMSYSFMIWEHFIANASHLSIPLSITLFLAREFAQTARSLAQKLTEVEILSAQSITQEQEKQQILATQNETLEHQVAERTSQLQASQAQLIQREKLASLGELTAGIAHEIQNPLNFVNNFAEVSAEMALEMKEEMDKGETEEAKYIADDLILNLQKINHHGKRASSIVKNMLEHSRSSTGEKAPTQLNTLLDECLRLSYHGMRAQENDFQAEYSLDLEADLPEVVVVAQDISRVLLNLFNNAFYAVHQKRKQLPADTEYIPKVSASSRKTEQGIEIRISDNGSGIPEAIRDKIFQPFFTTKPTGEGTGLGLSLAYDIITKGHGGSLALDVQSGEGTSFIIILPL